MMFPFLTTTTMYIFCVMIHKINKQSWMRFCLPLRCAKNVFFSFKVFYMDQKVQIFITYMFTIACARNPPIMYKNIIIFFLENIAYRLNTLIIGTSQISFRLYEYHELPISSFVGLF